jgi:ribosomal protein S18 acetylase RimI-like enzyme
MTQENIKQYICLKKDIDNEDYDNIHNLEDICFNHDRINLKLELEYKLGLRCKKNNPLKAVNEFIYYSDKSVIGYMGIASFGRNTAEISGMVHPEWRRKGIFTRLYELAIEECTRRKFEKILLLCDNKSEAAKQFIKSTGAKYSFSEYKMKFTECDVVSEGKPVTLRKANTMDGEEIGRLDSIFWGELNIQISNPEEEEKNNRITYMIETEGKLIGKIRVESDEKIAYIYGFGILDEYRGKGYGREALRAALKLINNSNINNVYLDVAANNNRALNLYKSCGFVEEAVMNYYVV